MAQRCPCLVVFPQTAGAVGSGIVIELAADTQLARPLRERRLSEECGPAALSASPLGGDCVLACADGCPVWWRRPGRSNWAHYSAFCPEELGANEALRDQLRAGRFMGLVPLLHLLRHICRELAWEERPLAAAFVVDDPNLHRSSYGHLGYRELIAHADRHGYHLGLATVPLDGWMSSRRASALVKSSPRALSLLMHGNDHVAGELGRLTDDRLAESVLAQALRRTLALERRCGIAIERVMVPPHEVCSATALSAMFRLGFEGACIGRRHPWRDSGSLSKFASAPLIKWHPTDLIDEGLPILPRYPIDRSREDLVFRALLGQPLIPFAHHWDFADGLDLLEQVASDINSLGDVRWGSIGSIARNCFFTRRTGQTLHVQMHSRRVVVDIPQGVCAVQVSAPSLTADGPQRHLAYGEARVALANVEGRWMSDALPVTPATPIELALTPKRPLDPATVPNPPRTPWPIVRRLLVEGRDRSRPLLGR